MLREDINQKRMYEESFNKTSVGEWVLIQREVAEKTQNDDLRQYVDNVYRRELIRYMMFN